MNSHEWVDLCDTPEGLQAAKNRWKFAADYPRPDVVAMIRARKIKICSKCATLNCDAGAHSDCDRVVVRAVMES